MKTVSLFILVVVLILIGIFTISTLDNAVLTPEGVLAEKDTQSDPCWFMSAKGFESVPETVMKSRQDREMYGYPGEIDIDKALRVFNDEQRCLSVPFKPLTKDELLASLSTTEDYGNEDLSGLRKSIKEKITSDGMLPRGSLLVREVSGNKVLIEEYSDGERLYGSDGQALIDRVYLFFDLDKKDRMEPIDRSRIFLIRKVYIGRESGK
jgi:hypothetical protein